MRFSLRATLTLGAAILCSTAFSQLIPLSQALTPRPLPKSPAMKWTQPHGRVNFNSNIGSFKLLSNAEIPVEGELDFMFRGTVLISDMDPNSKLLISGNVRKEIDDKKNNKVAYFGNGRMTFTGRARALQFFGRNIRGTFNGFGVLRTVGEFDKNLDTGLYWFTGDKEKQYWATSVLNVGVPKSQGIVPKVTITPKKSGG